MKPTLFNDKMKERILKLTKEGKTLAEVAFYIGVSERVLYNWAGKYGDFKTALQESRAIADELVEASLFQRAVGYTHKETKAFFDSQSLQIITKKISKHHPPDTGAAKFWLTNRDPEKWKEKTEVEHSGKIAKMTDEELEQMVISTADDIKKSKKAKSNG